MQDRNAGRSRREGAEPAGLSPVRAFFLLATIATAAGVGLFATRDASPAEPRPLVSPQESPDDALTDEEAIAEFERLKNLLLTAYRRRDITLIDEFAAPNPARGISRIYNEIRTLIADNVLYRTREVREDIVLATNGTEEIEVREVVVKKPRFVHAATGRNLATSARAERQSVVWELRSYGGEWRIYSATIVSAEPVKP